MYACAYIGPITSGFSLAPLELPVIHGSLLSVFLSVCISFFPFACFLLVYFIWGQETGKGREP